MSGLAPKVSLVGPIQKAKSVPVQHLAKMLHSEPLCSHAVLIKWRFHNSERYQLNGPNLSGHISEWYLLDGQKLPSHISVWHPTNVPSFGHISERYLFSGLSFTYGNIYPYIRKKGHDFNVSGIVYSADALAPSLFGTAPAIVMYKVTYYDFIFVTAIFQSWRSSCHNWRHKVVTLS